MSISWKSCNVCGTTFPDCGDYVYCECNRYWCSYECAQENGFTELDEDDYTEEEWYNLTEEQKRSCNYCRGEEFEDFELLEFALDYFGCTREALITSYKERK